MPFPPLSRLALAAAALLALAGAAAQETKTDPVYTRARLMSSHEEPGGKLYLHLKIPPRSKIPFTTQTFRLADRRLVADIADGTPVEFVSRRLEGENTVVAIRAVAECPRFQKC